MKLYFCNSTLPQPAQQHELECIFVTLEVYLTTLYSEIFSFSYFLGDMMGQDRDRQLYVLGKVKSFITSPYSHLSNKRVYTFIFF